MSDTPTSDEPTPSFRYLMVTPNVDTAETKEERDERYYAANPWAERDDQTPSESS